MSDAHKSGNYPSQEDFILLLEDLRRRIERLLRRDERPLETDSPFLREAMLALTQRWRRIEKADAPPEPESPSSKEPSDDGEPPP